MPFSVKRFSQATIIVEVAYLLWEMNFFFENTRYVFVFKKMGKKDCNKAGAAP